MKKTFIKIAGAILILGASLSCNYLDVDPELGATDEDVFGTFKNLKLYLQFYFDADHKKENIYCGMPMYVDMNAYRFTWVGTTDAADNGRLMWPTTQLKKGVLQEDYISLFCDGDGNMPVASAMWKIIRIANMTLEHVGGIADGKPNEVADVIAQAYFVRAYAHFCLCRFHGGVPYIDHVLKSDESWDLERLSGYETYIRCAEDMRTAFDYYQKAGVMRRDAYPGEPGFLTVSDLKFPAGITAKAMLARILLYAASPLNNQKGKEDWENAAKAYAEAIDLAAKEQYSLCPFSEYVNNFIDYKGTCETLWSGYWSETKDNAEGWANFLAYPQSYYAKASGLCPTQNYVDKFETKWGDPLNTEEDRKRAQELGHYNPQDPYSNLDPRFYVNVIYDGCTSVLGTGGEPVNIYYDPETDSYPKTTLSNTSVQFGIAWGSMDSDTKGYSNTGYYYRKMWNGIRGDKGAKHLHVDPIIRLPELYLSYAEAVNEAYGPHGSVPGYDLTAVDAVNIVRARCDMPPVQERFLSSTEAFRERIQNERNVEFAYEGNNYYFDIRRWKIAPVTMTQTLYGMYVEKVPVSEQYPNGRRYERRPLPEIRQGTWKDYMYYFPFSKKMAQTMTTFVNNEAWN